MAIADISLPLCPWWGSHVHDSCLGLSTPSYCHQRGGGSPHSLPEGLVVLLSRLVYHHHLWRSHPIPLGSGGRPYLSYPVRLWGGGDLCVQTGRKESPSNIIWEQLFCPTILPVDIYTDLCGHHSMDRSQQGTQKPESGEMTSTQRPNIATTSPYRAIAIASYVDGDDTLFSKSGGAHTPCDCKAKKERKSTSLCIF